MGWKIIPFIFIKTTDELSDDAYLEFLPGKYNGKHWGEQSAYIPDDGIEIIWDLLTDVNEKFDTWEITEFSKEQINILLEKLSERLKKLEINFDDQLDESWFAKNYHQSSKDHYKKHKEEILLFFKEIIKWLSEIQESHLTIIGF
jgi:hypothetical protein